MEELFERARFALIAEAVGILAGFVLALVVQEKGGPFPSFIVVAITCIFAASGAFMRRAWIDGVIKFFRHVWPSS